MLREAKGSIRSSDSACDCGILNDISDGLTEIMNKSMFRKTYVFIYAEFVCLFVFQQRLPSCEDRRIGYNALANLAQW